MSTAELNPFLLAAITPDPDPRLLPLLRSTPSLASQQDSHGYSLLHAAASYNHVSVLRSLVLDSNVNVNLIDEDGETCLFVVESVDVAKCLVEELGIDTAVTNEDGLTAQEKIELEGEFPEVAEYLREPGQVRATGLTNGATSMSTVGAGTTHPPPLPSNIRLDVNTITETPTDAESLPQPDPEFRRRIEELAAREDFNTEEGQRELRDLITDAVRGGVSDGRDVRRRVG